MNAQKHCNEKRVSVISVVFASRDRQPGVNEARSPKLPYPALDSRQSAILYLRPWLASQHDGHGDDGVIDHSRGVRQPEPRAVLSLPLAGGLSSPIVPALELKLTPVPGVRGGDCGPP